MSFDTRRRLLLGAAAAGLAPGLLRAQPDRPVLRILVGLPPGGGTDAIARAIADRLPEQLGQPVIIDNRVGAGGRLACDALAAARPDGLTWMIAPNATPTFQTLVFGSQLKWDLWRDFAPVATLASYPLGMAVSTATGATDLPSFVQWVRAHPKEATFGVPGLGGQNHFLGVQLAKAAGIELPVTPYKGTPPLVTDLAGGHVSAAITLMDEMLKHHRSGRVRVIGIFGERRSPLMPDIPTMAEQGLRLVSEGWTAMWAPARTPRAEVARMQAALRKVLEQPAVRELLTARLSVLPDYQDDQRMAQRQREELALWAPIIKASGFRPE